MRAIIPVAGVGSRLKPHTHTTPKVLLNVGGKPILGHILDKLAEEGIKKATFVIGHLGEMIQEYILKNYPSFHSDFVEQQEMEGLGHAIFKALPTVEEEEIFIILGDTVFDVNLKEVFKNKVSSLGVKEVEDPRRFGVAVTENGLITKLVEKPQDPVSKLALVGLYYFSDSRALAASLTKLVDGNIRTNGEYQLTDAIQLMIEAGEKIRTFPVEGWYDCGKPETLLSTNRFLLDRNGHHKAYKDVVIKKPVYIADNVEICNSVIGPYATIDSGSRIDNSIIKNTIIGMNAKVTNAMLENSIIGNNSVIKGSHKRLNSGDSSEIEFY